MPDVAARFLRAARQRAVLVGGLKVSAVVGTILNAINQLPGWVSGAPVSLPHLMLNYCVPFGVSVYSAARIAMRDAAGDRPD